MAPNPSLPSRSHRVTAIRLGMIRPQPLTSIDRGNTKLHTISVDESLVRRHRLIAINLGFIHPRTLTRIERGSMDAFNWMRRRPVVKVSPVSPTLNTVWVAWQAAHQALQARAAAKELAKAA